MAVVELGPEETQADVDAKLRWLENITEEGKRAVFRRRVEAIQRIRSDPGCIPALKAHYAGHFLDWVRDWGVTLDPRLAATGISPLLPFVPFPRQERYFTWLENRWRTNRPGMVEKSRDCGATWCSVQFAVWLWLFHPGVIIGFGSRKEEYIDKIGDPKAIFEMIRRQVEFTPKEFLPLGFNPDTHSKYMTLTNPESGASIIGEAGDNIGRGGRTSIYFVDEAAFIERAIKNEASLLANTNVRIDLSTVNGPDNPFAQKRRAGNVDCFVFDWRHDPRKNNAWYEAKRQELSDPALMAQEYDRDYQASKADSTVPHALVRDAMSKGRTEVSQMGYPRLALDVARFGVCESVLTLLRGRAVLYQKAWKETSVTTLAALVRAEIMQLGGQYQLAQIAVDDTGVGGGVTDLLKEWFPRPKFVEGVIASRPASNGKDYNVRSLMYRGLVEWLEMGNCSLPNDPKLQAQLGAVAHGFRAGLRLLAPKEEMRDKITGRQIESPDRADSLALLFAVPATDPHHEERGSQWADPGVIDSVVGY